MPDQLDDNKKKKTRKIKKEVLANVTEMSGRQLYGGSAKKTREYKH